MLMKSRNLENNDVNCISIRVENRSIYTLSYLGGGVGYCNVDPKRGV